jgi:hypothetical protein
MNKNRVILIVDRGFGDRLNDLPESTPVWVVDSDVNHPFIVSRWERANANPRFAGLTSFQDSPTLSSADLAVSMVVTIDEHHGAYSQKPPFSCFTVIGTNLDSSLVSSAEEIGFTLVSSTDSILEFTRK